MVVRVYSDICSHIVMRHALYVHKGNRVCMKRSGILVDMFVYLSMFHFAVAADDAFVVVRLGFIP